MVDPTQAPGDPAEPRASRRPRFGWSWSWGPVAIFLGLLCLVIYGRMSGLFLLTQRQQLELASQHRQTQAALAQSAGFRAAAILMAAPGTVSLQARTRPGAPQAEVYLNPARGAVLVASALPPAGSGRAYQLWLLPSDGNLRPAGTFQADVSGNAVASFAHPLGGAIGLAVSLEPSSGSAQPTGAIILAARQPKL